MPNRIQIRTRNRSMPKIYKTTLLSSPPSLLYPQPRFLAMEGGGKRSRCGRRKKRRRNAKEFSSSKEAATGEGSSSHPSRQLHPRPDQQQQPQTKRRRKCNEEASNSSTSRLLDKMRARLSGGHFRMLNEKLYTCSGHEAFDLFKKDPDLFNVYHAGYQQQMSNWPQQPMNGIIKWLKEHSPSLIVADFGCGNASLAKAVKNKVFSIDLVANNPSVIACDMAHTPLVSSSVDVAVFCLSLMGTNFPNYLGEANRVLKPSGWLLIAEVRSRLDPNNGGADPDQFSKAVHKLGFSSVSKDFSNKMFVLFYFRKKEKTSGTSIKDIEWPELKPCMYKRR